MTKIVIIGILVILINVPFGYWRSNVRRFSLQWFLAIHIPVPFIIVLRLISGIGFAWYTYVILVAAFFMGQQSGTFIMRRIHKACSRVSSCMVMDLARCILA